MACRLLDAKPLYKPMLGYCHLHHYEQNAVKYQSKCNLSIREYVYENIVQGEGGNLTVDSCLHARTDITRDFFTDIGAVGD